MDEKKFALLIDADNISAKYVKTMLDELTKYGTVTYKRLYGDLTKSNNRSWKDALLAHSIIPIQQYNYTTGKNSTDSAMIIDAMDILYTGHIDGLCIASSDSDFTRLAMRVRESGLTVFGMGESKTPEPFRTSCERFFYLDLLSEDSLSDTTVSEKTEEDAITPLSTIEAIIRKIITENGVDATSMDIGELGSRITKSDPAFDIRNYGYNKFSKFLAQFSSLRLQSTETAVTAILQETSLSLDSIEKEIINLIIETGKDNMNVGELNKLLQKKYPSFNCNDYGYSRFSKMLQEFDGIRVLSFGKTVALSNTVKTSSKGTVSAQILTSKVSATSNQKKSTKPQKILSVKK